VTAPTIPTTPLPVRPRGVVAVLQAARRLLADPAVWVQGTAAVDEQGRPVPFDDPGACAFCAVAAVARAAALIGATPDVEEDATEALEAAAALLHGQAPQVFNDAPGTSHGEVLELLDVAVEVAGPARSWTAGGRR